MRILTADGLLFGDLQPIDSADVPLWVRASRRKAAIRIEPSVFSEGRFHPESFYYSFYQGLIAEDMILLRVITDPAVCKVPESIPLAEALLDIFSHAGRVNQLLTGLAAVEFNDPAMETTSVLRRNSHLTNLFKVFVDRFGNEFSETIIGKLRTYILGLGDLGLRGQGDCDVIRTQKAVLSTLKTIMHSGPFLPPQMRHIASVLRTFVGYRFNRIQPVVNALSGFFALRFFTPMFIEDPATARARFSSVARPTENDTFLKSARKSSVGQIRMPDATLLLPFAQVLQVPLNLALYHGSYTRFSSLHHHLLKNVFPRLIAFTLSIADLDESPNYPAPARNVVEKAILTVVEAIGKNKEQFQKKYRKLCDKSEGRSPASFAFGAFLMSFFTTTYSDE
jgi:hypothetical protein